MRRARALLRAAAAVAGLAVALVAAPALGADVRVVEAVGAVPVVRGQMAGPPRDLAIQAGLREAVTRVAADLLLEAEASLDPEAGDPAAQLADLLGGDLVRYTSRFRIREDRGERPALFADEPDASAEYVVVVEVHVDVDRIRARLVETGMLARDPNVERVVVLLDLEGLHAWPAYARIRDTLLERVGAESVVPLGFERGRARLEVASRLSGPELLDRLLRAAPPELRLEPLGAREDALRVHVTWTPPPSDDRGALRGPARARRSARAD